jgi:hypothetical protein
MSEIIQQGLVSLFGVAPSSASEWMIFDKNYLHVDSVEGLNKLPWGSEIILIEKSVALLPMDNSEPSENQPPSTVE